MKRWLVLLAVGLTFGLARDAAAACANTWTVLDSGGTTRTFCRTTDGANWIFAQQLIDSSGAPLGVGGNPLIVSGAATTQPVSYGSGTFVTSDTHFPASALLSDSLANPNTTTLGSANLGWDATNSVWRRLQVVAGTGTLQVSTSGTQTITGSVTVSGGSITASQGTPPWAFNQTQVNSVALGSPTAYGTAPTGNVQGVNAFITNSPAVSQSGTWTIQQGGTWTVQQGTPPWSFVKGDVNPWSTNLTQVNNAAVSLGQKAMAGSFPVVIASDQGSFPVVANPGSGTFNTSDFVHFPSPVVLSDSLSNPSVSGIAAYMLGFDTTTQAWRRATIDDATGAQRVAVVAGGGTGGTSANFGSAFPAAGTAAGFRNAAANLDYAMVDANHWQYATANIIQVGGAALALGQGTMAASLPVTMASNQTPVPISQVSSTAGAGIIPVQTTAAGASSFVAKASAGNLFSFTFNSGSTAGCLYVFDAATAPAFGSFSAPLLMVPINMVANQAFGSGSILPPIRAQNGIVFEYSSTCGATTTAAASGIYTAMVQ